MATLSSKITIRVLTNLWLLSSVVAFVHTTSSKRLLLVGRLSSLSSVSHVPSLQRYSYQFQRFSNEKDRNNAQDDSTQRTSTSTESRLSCTSRRETQQHCYHQPLLSRRSSLQHCMYTCVTAMLLLPLTNTDAAAAEVGSNEEVRDNKASTRTRKPYAPLVNLLPATRVLVLINTAVETAQALTNKQQQQQQSQLLETLKELILVESKQPSTFFKTATEAAASKTYLQIDTWQTWKKARQSETSAKSSSFLDAPQSFSVNPFTSLNEAAEQWGERTQFSRLQKQQLALERKNPMRAAFNAYTNNLLFGDRYTLTADPAVKSRLIRDDRLPDVTSVVRSDLDLRDLFRNQVLTAWEDARAELEYQLKMSSTSSSSSSATLFDATELLALLRLAQSSCQEWFKFVPDEDMKEALEVVQNEQRNQAS